MNGAAMAIAIAALLTMTVPAVASTDGGPTPASVTSEQTVSLSYSPAVALTPRQAARKVGRTKTVCGKVASTKYARYSSGGPTFLNLGRAYPNEIFTIVIWREYRSLYPRAPHKMFRNKTVCVRGRISRYAGTPQIEARYNRVWKR